VVPPGVSTTLDEAEQVDPRCSVKRSMAAFPLFSRDTLLSLVRRTNGDFEAERGPGISPVDDASLTGCARTPALERSASTIGGIAPAI
jgi:hypothetical protein